MIYAHVCMREKDARPKEQYRKPTARTTDATPAGADDAGTGAAATTHADAGEERKME